jgi:hypothetical protein
MRRYTLVLIAALMVLAGCLAVAPARAHAVPLGARAAAAHTYSSDPLAGNNWSHQSSNGLMWFRVGYPNYSGRYKVTWHNASGSHFSFYIARLSDNIYYEVKHHRNTYTFYAGYKIRAHYVNTKGHYVNVIFERVGG